MSFFKQSHMHTFSSKGNPMCPIQPCERAVSLRGRIVSSWRGATLASRAWRTPQVGETTTFTAVLQTCAVIISILIATYFYWLQFLRKTGGSEPPDHSSMQALSTIAQYVLPPFDPATPLVHRHHHRRSKPANSSRLFSAPSPNTHSCSKLRASSPNW